LIRQDLVFTPEDQQKCGETLVPLIDEAVRAVLDSSPSSLAVGAS
jgi:hypothetical protein